MAYTADDVAQQRAALLALAASIRASVVPRIAARAADQAALELACIGWLNAASAPGADPLAIPDGAPFSRMTHIGQPDGISMVAALTSNLASIRAGAAPLEALRADLGRSLAKLEGLPIDASTMGTTGLQASVNAALADVRTVLENGGIDGRSVPPLEILRRADSMSSGPLR